MNQGMDLQRLLLTAAANNGSLLGLDGISQLLNGNYGAEVVNPVPKEPVSNPALLELLARSVAANYTNPVHVPEPAPQPTLMESLTRMLLEKALYQQGLLPAAAPEAAGFKVPASREHIWRTLEHHRDAQGSPVESLHRQVSGGAELSLRRAGSGGFSEMNRADYNEMGSPALPPRPGSSCREMASSGLSSLHRQSSLSHDAAQSHRHRSPLQKAPPAQGGAWGGVEQALGPSHWYPGPEQMVAPPLQKGTPLPGTSEGNKPTLSGATWPGTVDIGNLMDWMGQGGANVPLEDTANSLLFPGGELSLGGVAFPSISEGSSVMMGGTKGGANGAASVDKEQQDKKRKPDEASSVDSQGKKVKMEAESMPTSMMAPPCVRNPDSVGPSTPSTHTSPPRPDFSFQNTPPTSHPPSPVLQSTPLRGDLSKRPASPHKQSPSPRPIRPAGTLPPLQGLAKGSSAEGRNSPAGDDSPKGVTKTGRVKRGRATDPHSFAERVRREKMAERMGILLQFIPGAAKLDKIGQLDQIIEYVTGLRTRISELEGKVEHQGKADEGPVSKEES